MNGKLIAKFSMWLPEKRRVPRYMIVLVPGSQSDGRGMINDIGWQEFATEQGVGLVGCFFCDPEPSGIEEYADAKESGAALKAWLITQFGHCPFLLVWGFSAGGQFAYEFAVQHPRECAAFVVNKGGVYYTALAPAATRAIPGLFITGQNDSEWRQLIVKGICKLNKIAGAKAWSLYEDPGVGHSIGKSVEWGMSLFKGVLEPPK